MGSDIIQNKILILTTGYPKNQNDMSNIYLHRFAIALKEKGQIIHVIAPDSPDTVKEDSIEGIYIHRFQYLFPKKIQSFAYGLGLADKIKTLSGKLQTIPFLISMTYNLIKYTRMYDYDVINAHWAIPTGFLAVVTKPIHKKPIIIRIYGAELYPFLKNNGCINKMFRSILKYSLNKSDYVIANSIATANIGKLISGRNNIFPLPDGVDIKYFNPNVNYDKLASIYQKDSRHIIFATGHMIERKGFEYLLRSLPFVLESISNVLLIIGGEGPERDKLEKIVKSMDLEKYVRFPGFIKNEDLPKYMRMSDIFILPSIIDKNGDTEGLGLVRLRQWRAILQLLAAMLGEYQI